MRILYIYLTFVIFWFTGIEKTVNLYPYLIPGCGTMSTFWFRNYIGGITTTLKKALTCKNIGQIITNSKVLSNCI
jgi:hypothetical protein